MPRVYTSANDPLDFCYDCFPTEQKAKFRYNDLGDGPDDRGNCFDYDAQHPPYDEQYRCADCQAPLEGKDD